MKHLDDWESRLEWKNAVYLSLCRVGANRNRTRSDRWIGEHCWFGENNRINDEILFYSKKSKLSGRTFLDSGRVRMTRTSTEFVSRSKSQQQQQRSALCQSSTSVIYRRPSSSRFSNGIVQNERTNLRGVTLRFTDLQSTMTALSREVKFPCSMPSRNRRCEYLLTTERKRDDRVCRSEPLFSQLGNRIGLVWSNLTEQNEREKQTNSWTKKQCDRGPIVVSVLLSFVLKLRKLLIG